MRPSCPGRDAAFFTLLRRTGTVLGTGVRYGPGSAAHREERCAASGTRLQTPLAACHRARDLAGDVAFGAAEVVEIGGRDLHIDGVAAAACDAEPAVGAAS